MEIKTCHFRQMTLKGWFLVKIRERKLMLSDQVMKELRLIIIAAFGLLAGLRMFGKTDFATEYNMQRNVPTSELVRNGEEYMNRNDKDRALISFTAAVSRYPNGIPEQEKKEVIEALNGIGIIHFLNSNYTQAYSYFTRSIEIDGNFDDSPGYINLAGLLHYCGDENRCMDLLRKSFNYAADQNHEEQMCMTFVNLMNLSYGKRREREYSDIIRRMLAHRPKKEIPEYIHSRLVAEAVEASVKEDYNKAVNRFKDIIDESDRYFMPQRVRFDANVNISETFRRTGRLDSAMAYMKEAEKLGISERQPDMVIESTRYLADLCLESGDSTGYRHYRYRWLELSDSVLNSEELGKVHNMEMAYEADKLGREIEKLSLEKDFRLKLVIVVSVGLLTVVVLLGLVLHVNKKLRYKNEELFRKNLDILSYKNASAMSTEPESGEPSDTRASGGPSVPTELPDERQNGRRNYVLSDKAINEFWCSIEKVMADEKRFCEPDFSLVRLASLLNSNTKYISQVIQHKTGKTFSALLAERRIDVVCRRLIDMENYGHLTLEGIIEGVGYKSRSTFSRAFKKHTGLTPSEYQRMARKEDSSAIYS